MATTMPAAGSTSSTGPPGPGEDRNLRDEDRVRKEIEARQAWVVVAARMAFAAPWFVLVLLSTREEAAVAYRDVRGGVVIGVGAALSLAGYRLMLAIGRVPPEERVLR